MSLSNLFRTHWLLIGILCSVFLAEIIPSIGATGGPLKPEWTVKYIAVAVIFFFSGFSISVNDLTVTSTRIGIHLFIQLFTFIFIPLFVLAVNEVLKRAVPVSVNNWILKGLATVSCMPPPLSSAVILTRAVGGNEAVAAFNSIIGSFIGLLVTPFILLLILGSTAVVSVFSSAVVLGQTVLLPLFLGQLARILGFFTILSKSSTSTISQLALLYIIFTTLCDAFYLYDTPMNALDILVTILLVLVIQILLLYICFKGACSIETVGRGSPRDIVAVTFCATHKSLTLGLPILHILYAGYAHFSLVTLPLLIYHPTQLILGGLLVQYFKIWMDTNKLKLLP